MPSPPIRPVTRRLALTGLVLLVTGAVACGRQDTASPTEITTVTTSTTTAPTTTTTTVPEVLSESDSAPTTTPPDVGTDDGRGGDHHDDSGWTKLIRLRGDGLGTVAFGTSESDAVDSLTAQLGDPKRSRSRSPSCGSRTVAEWSSLGITAFFSRGTFAGWEVARRGSAVTAEGLGVGSNMGHVRNVYGERFEWLHDNLDNEFAIDRHGSRTFIGGVADGTEDSSRVRRLWAGYTCSAG